jgi:hypothetical protein
MDAFLNRVDDKKNSKGLLIKKIIDPKARWYAIIIFLCFTPTGRESNRKMTMVEEIS